MQSADREALAGMATDWAKDVDRYEATIRRLRSSRPYERGFEEGARSVLERLTSDEAVTSAVALAMPRLWSRERRYEIADAALAAVAAALSSPIESETRDGD